MLFHAFLFFFDSLTSKLFKSPSKLPMQLFKSSIPSQPPSQLSSQPSLSDNLNSVVFIRYIIVIIFIVSIIKTNSSLPRSPISIYFVYKITNGLCSFLHIVPVPLQSLIRSVPDYRSPSFFRPGSVERTFLELFFCPI